MNRFLSPVGKFALLFAILTMFGKSDAADTQRQCLPYVKTGVAGQSSVNFSQYPSLRRMVEESLRDQRLLLIRSRCSLIRWSPRDRVLFAKWFGTTAPIARQRLLVCLNRELALNARYTAANFSVHSRLRANVLASVNPDNPGTIFIDAAFLIAPRFGPEGRASTLIHEFSHLKIVYGSVDTVYGVEKCLALARKNPLAALNNADNVGGYADEAGR